MYDLGIQKILINIIYPKNIGYRTREIYCVSVVVMLVANLQCREVAVLNIKTRQEEKITRVWHAFTFFQ